MALRPGSLQLLLAVNAYCPKQPLLCRKDSEASSWFAQSLAHVHLLVCDLVGDPVLAITRRPTWLMCTTTWPLASLPSTPSSTASSRCGFDSVHLPACCWCA